MNQVIQNILTRRSIRGYKEEQISNTDLEIIIEAAKYAPSGGNSQSWNFTVLQNKDKLEELNNLIREAFQNMLVDDDTYSSKKSGKVAARNNEYNFYYHAPTLIIVSNDRKYSNAMADSAVALENIFLASHSIGLGSCWINQIAWFCDEPKIRKLLNACGIPENYVVCGAAAVGYSSMNEIKHTSRKKIVVNII
ncbi:MAG: nitroreductase family protein [Clostridiaceae bacterium]|nr:nitroreductase family protein [Clostridiaceae bacterium]